MSLSGDVILLISLAYVALLFGVAFYADWRSTQGRPRWLNNPYIYTLSISIYCTSWTFYGAVGTAARSGIEYATIYLGPTLVFVGWFAFMRKLVRISQRESITSIADFISSRFGKSPALAAIVTLIAVVATLPYIALQLKAVAASYRLLIEPESGDLGRAFAAPVVDEAMFRTAFWVAVGMAAFTILFGTRNLDAKERHHGLVAAIAIEAVVKLAALIAVGVFALTLIDAPTTTPIALVGEGADQGSLSLFQEHAFDARWVALTFLAATAVICLPRQFHVTVVECEDEDHGRTASWAFPAYLFLISLFVLPIAAAGATLLPSSADPDLYVLTLPLAMGEAELALFVFLGGFSSATSMVIVACIALSTMVANHLVLPIAMGSFRPDGPERPTSGDVRRFLLMSRRVSICAILFLGFLYFRLSGASEGLANIGLIAFVGVAQLLPSLIAAMYWPRANARGAMAGLIAGFTLWAMLSFAPSFLPSDPDAVAALSPTFATIVFVLGLQDFDPLVKALFWSLSVNCLFLAAGSLSRASTPLERVQSAKFVDVFRGAGDEAGRAIRVSAGSSDLFVVAQRILGPEAALRFFEAERTRQGLADGLPAADDALIERLERRLAGSVGAASARAMVANVATGETVSLQELIGIADEAARLVDYSHRLEEKSSELERTAAQLRAANARLQRLDAQKDEFLSQVSHELRTPMTALRSFSDILLGHDDLSSDQARRFLGIIHDESLRLTRLLDQILDISQLERAALQLRIAEIDPEVELDRAMETCAPLAGDRRVAIHRSRPVGAVRIEADADRLRQVFLNVLSNAVKYNSSPRPAIWIDSQFDGAVYEATISDNGPGVSETDREIIFSRFARGANAAEATGAGLGLAICRQIVDRHGGDIALVSNPGEGAAFRIRLPAAHAHARAAQPSDA